MPIDTANPVPQIGKRKPLIIRKNNFIQTNNSGIS